LDVSQCRNVCAGHRPNRGTFETFISLERAA